jgi:hypothetical protein
MQFYEKAQRLLINKMFDSLIGLGKKMIFFGSEDAQVINLTILFSLPNYRQLYLKG